MTKTQTTKTASNNANISTWIDSLATKRETWENGTYKASNEELYVLLDECVDLFKEVRVHRSLVKKLNLILEEREIMMRSNTSLATKIVRLIFGDCGKRAYTYARVLTVAAAAATVSTRAYVYARLPQSPKISRTILVARLVLLRIIISRSSRMRLSFLTSERCTRTSLKRSTHSSSNTYSSSFDAL